MKSKRLKKTMVAFLLAAVWAAAAWQTFIMIGVLSMTRMPKGFFRAAGSIVISDFGPRWTVKPAINGAAKCDKIYGALDTVEKLSKEQSRNGSIVSYKKMRASGI